MSSHLFSAANAVDSSRRGAGENADETDEDNTFPFPSLPLSSSSSHGVSFPAQCDVEGGSKRKTSFLRGGAGGGSSHRGSRHASDERQSLVALRQSICRRTEPLLQHLSSLPIPSSSSLAASQRSLRSLSSPSFRRASGVKELSRRDVEIGELLGRGGFSRVYEVTNVRRASFMPPAEAFAGVGASEGDGDGNDDDDAAESKFVVKHLRTTLRGADRERFHAAAADLALEARILSSLSHPNIIRLRGVTRGCEASALFSGRREETTGRRDSHDDDDEGEGGSESDLGGYFLVLDKLECTLEEKQEEWRTERKALRAARRRIRPWGRKSQSQDVLSQGLSESASSNHRGTDNTDAGRLDRRPARAEAKRRFFLRRLDVARQIARAVCYLHSHRILYRDLKPANVGFVDCGGGGGGSGTVKIFDFGLARFLPPPSSSDGEKEKEEEEFRPTGLAGTPRYMAPEVAKGEPYGRPADVYSFGLLLWEMLALEKPFGRRITPTELRETVTYGTRRPRVDTRAGKGRWSAEVRGSMTRCWVARAGERPQLEEVLSVLDLELEGFS